ncbi:unnamed protein product [Phytophthora fragariaefolia]|uniref:Unnamed protein product n=1 Tax=Phytophthora fragariaefolia TaxID=1490495 RepID=A0A9W6WT76_9STRA|nr:unnamed protein product [Phytophthora fragariaefolia]
MALSAGAARVQVAADAHARRGAAERGRKRGKKKKAKRSSAAESPVPSPPASQAPAAAAATAAAVEAAASASESYSDDGLSAAQGADQAQVPAQEPISRLPPQAANSTLEPYLPCMAYAGFPRGLRRQKGSLGTEKYMHSEGSRVKNVETRKSLTQMRLGYCRIGR